MSRHERNLLWTDRKLLAGTVTLSTRVVLTATATSVAQGSSLTLTENAASANSSIVPGGEVTFPDGTTTLGPAAPVNGVATFSVHAGGRLSLDYRILMATSGLVPSTSAAVTVTHHLVGAPMRKLYLSLILLLASCATAQTVTLSASHFGALAPATRNMYWWPVLSNGHPRATKSMASGRHKTHRSSFRSPSGPRISRCSSVFSVNMQPPVARDFECPHAMSIPI